jgi:hypothetical protein
MNTNVHSAAAQLCRRGTNVYKQGVASDQYTVMQQQLQVPEQGVALHNTFPSGSQTNLKCCKRVTTFIKTLRPEAVP